MVKTDSQKIDEFFSDNQRLTQAMGTAVQDAMRVHKLLGHPIVTWRDGKVVIVPPQEIEVDGEKDGPPKLPNDAIP